MIGPSSTQRHGSRGRLSSGNSLGELSDKQERLYDLAGIRQPVPMLRSLDKESGMYSILITPMYRQRCFQFSCS